MVQPLLDGGRIKGMAHITGGGITDNLPRVLPHGTAAVIDRSAWEVPALFTWLQRSGNVPDEDMLRTFNMGIGLIIVSGRDQAEPLIDELAARGGHNARVIGEVVAGRTAVSGLRVSVRQSPPGRPDLRPRQQSAGADRRDPGPETRCHDRCGDLEPSRRRWPSAGARRAGIETLVLSHRGLCFS